MRFMQTRMRMSEHKINQRWFADRLLDKQLSQRQFAKKLGLDPSAVTLLFQGKRAMKMTEAAQIAALLGVPVSEVLENAGVNPTQGGTQEVNLVGWIDGSGEFHPEQTRRKIPAPVSMPVNTVAVQCRTAMTPQEYMDGWVLYYQQPDGKKSDTIGKLCIVKLKGGLQMLAYVKRGYSPNLYNLFGAVHIVDAELEYSTPILWIRA